MYNLHQTLNSKHLVHQKYLANAFSTLFSEFGNVVKHSLLCISYTRLKKLKEVKNCKIKKGPDDGK